MRVITTIAHRFDGLPRMSMRITDFGRAHVIIEDTADAQPFDTVCLSMEPRHAHLLAAAVDEWNAHIAVMESINADRVD